MINKVFILGNLGVEPELRHTSTGTAVCEMRIATSRRIKRNDEWIDETEWHRVVAWSRTAEIAAEYLCKGSQAHIEGRLQTRQWEDRDGNTRYTTEIVCERLTLVGGRSTNQTSGGGRQTKPAASKKMQEKLTGVSEDDLPF